MTAQRLQSTEIRCWLYSLDIRANLRRYGVLHCADYLPSVVVKIPECRVQQRFGLCYSRVDGQPLTNMMVILHMSMTQQPLCDSKVHLIWRAKELLNVLAGQVLAIMSTARCGYLEEVVFEISEMRRVQNEVKRQNESRISTIALCTSARILVLSVELTFDHPCGRLLI